MLHIVQKDGISQLMCRKHEIISIHLENIKGRQWGTPKFVWEPLENPSLNSSEAYTC